MLTPSTAPNPDHHPMRLAIQASQHAADKGDGPFGATLVSPEGDILLVAANNAKTAADCTGHAEMVLIRQAQTQFGQSALRGAMVFASGEPCAMCAGALFWAGVGRIVFGASQADIIEVLGESPAMPINSRQTLAGAQPAVQIDGPVLGDEAVAVLRRAAERH